MQDVKIVFFTMDYAVNAVRFQKKSAHMLGELPAPCFGDDKEGV